VIVELLFFLEGEQIPSLKSNVWMNGINSSMIVVVLLQFVSSFNHNLNHVTSYQYKQQPLNTTTVGRLATRLSHLTFDETQFIQTASLVN